MACDDSSKATAIIKHKGKETKIESKYPGMTYTNESSLDAQGEDIVCEYKLTNYLPDGSSGIEIFRINPNKNIYVKTPQDGGVTGSGNYPAFVLYADDAVISAKYYPDQVVNMTVAFNGSCLGNGYLVEVFDKTGRIFKKFFPGEQPEVTIVCDDECPPGHIKCKHNGYPGYCCVSCKSTAEKINNLANKVKGK
ncbi:hypothetical protein [Nostoc sp. FACHB-280]|uniref:hypothetical protein n=1 Tax=Nostoc sp. FACHB-280 TaxID=2692839 RepID=UPI00168A7DB7|nr:hypothetical protein [Nostoc sp. FACHB-280]MBD2495009.1 hypothetical protein [Nostoc sp. FACHB-280]